jgi:hypothetical protein
MMASRGVAASQAPRKTELYLENEGALEDHVLDSVCRQTALSAETACRSGPARP